MVGVREPRIVVVDYDPSQALGTGLRRQGYDLRATTDGDALLQLLQEWLPDLVVLNLTEQITAGLHLCRRIRAVSSVFILALTNDATNERKVEALDNGIDDLIESPIVLDLLLAHIRAVLRRTMPVARFTEPWIAMGDFRVDLASRRVFVGNREVYLTPREFKLLTYMITNEGKVLTHRMLLEAVWGETQVQQPEALRSLIAHLRRKVEPNRSRPSYIRSTPWVGYKFTSRP